MSDNKDTKDVTIAVLTYRVDALADSQKAGFAEMRVALSELAEAVRAMVSQSARYDSRFDRLERDVTLANRASEAAHKRMDEFETEQMQLEKDLRSEIGRLREVFQSALKDELSPVKASVDKYRPLWGVLQWALALAGGALIAGLIQAFIKALFP